jgi:hypothetical protein
MGIFLHSFAGGLLARLRLINKEKYKLTIINLEEAV